MSTKITANPQASEAACINEIVLQIPWKQIPEYVDLQ
jgi:hypothetical protein